MPNLVLKSNIANRTFNVQHKVLKMPVKPGVVELVITPISNYTIDAKDFNFGFLPKQVSNIKYENLGEKVIAKLLIKSVIDSKKTLNILVPISGKSFVKKDSFIVTDITNISDNVLVTNTSLNPKSVIGNKTTYKITNDLNKKSLLFTKKFMVTGNNYFSLEPSYIIKNNNKRYAVVSKIERNGNNKIISKSFDFFYTSPKTISQSTITEIVFNAKSSIPSAKVSEIRATKKEENKIYSVDQGRSIGSEGGIKRMSVKGVPGTTFKIIVSNSSNAYNFKTGVFEASGGVFEGVVPPARLGRNYGESILYVKVPRTTTSDTITVRFIDDARIDHALITSPAAADTITSGASKVVQVETASTATLTVTINGEAGGTDFAMPLVTLEGGSQSSGEFYIGKGNSEVLTFKGTESSSNFEVYDFSFEVSVLNGSKAIKIVRQPLFVMPTGDTDNYVAWDSDETKKALAQQADGTSIPSDWDFEDAGLAGGLDVKIKAKVAGIGTVGASNSGFSSVLVKGSISVNNTGTVSSELKLTLLNFLTLVDAR